MDPERWKQVDALYQDALALHPEERDAFLRAACEQDEELNREVESLLRSQRMAGNFLETPAMEVAARDLAASDFRAGGQSGTPFLEHAQLSPGTTIAGRYTVIGLVGRGGMGEVYRARDNKLDQVVALKLLTASLRENPVALVALHSEVRLARQVSHPNVCRVHDIGEDGGLDFLTMEFIEGEDLATLLKRTGRFGQDRGIDIARRICAALSSAHERGVLHRDLKPGNVMIRSSGDVVVTDFGLAALADEMNPVESRSGTPAYMAPEQAAGGKVTVRSDIYSLGLVLYEIFTGQQAFEGEERTALKKPSLLVNDLDSRIERAILSCLKANPEERPATALSVAAMFPGGDPLQIALDAGQTPPPEMVAASGEKAGIGARSAVMCLVAALAALFGVLTFGSRAQVLSRAPIDRAGLAASARELAARIGYHDVPQGRGFGFLYDVKQIRLLEEQGWSSPAFSAPSPIRFWYRESPRPLGSYDMRGLAWDDPPQNVPGMISMQLDEAGRLTFFRALPAEIASETSSLAPDWTVLLSAAGLDPASLREVTPQIVPPDFADSRAAWAGAFTGRPGARVRVEAAALHGRPVYFRLIPYWEGNTVEPTQFDVAFQITARPYPPSYPGAISVLLGILTLGAGGMAWSNVKNGRGDRRGAFRVAVAVFALWLVYGLSIGFGQLQGTGERWWIIVANALYWAGTAWIYYMALEPLVRKRWPQSLVSWSRLWSGRLRDPLVGRDVLIGILAASWFTLARAQLPITVGSAIPAQFGAFIGVLPVALAASASGTLILAVFFTVVWMLSRRLWTAFLAACILQFIMNYFLGLAGGDWLQVAACSAYSLLIVTLLARFGVLACYMAMAASYLLFVLPVGLDFHASYQNDGRISIVLLAALAIYAFQSSLAGRRLQSQSS